jgi:hypothetical protein
MSLIYCYGVTKDSIENNIIGFNSELIYIISFKDIKAVVSEVSSNEFSQESLTKNFKDMSWLSQNAPIHEEVVTTIMGSQTIVPMKFCTIFSEKQNVLGMLEEKYADLKENLDRLKGTIEVSVKVYYSSSTLMDKAKKISKEISDLEEEKKSKSPGAAYFIDQKIDLLAKDLVGKLLYKEKHTVIQLIQSLALEYRENELLAKKVTKKDMVLNSAVLLANDSKEIFFKKLDELKLSHPLIEISVSGPFPPYNFVS